MGNYPSYDSPEGQALVEAEAAGPKTLADVYGSGNSINITPPTVLSGGKNATEIRSRNEQTGAEKGVKLARYDLIPTEPLRILAEHYGRGAQKYAERNWELGLDWSKLYAAAQRHLNQFWAGEDIDPETQTPHVISAAWMCFALCQMMETHPQLDDRPSVASQRDRADGQK